MDNNTAERNARTRAESIKNIGNNGLSEEAQKNKCSALIADADEMLMRANENYIASGNYIEQNGGGQLSGNKIKVFTKKVLRKLLNVFYGWFVAPILKKQTDYNQLTSNSVALLIQTNAKQNELIRELLRETEELKNNDPLEIKLSQYRAQYEQFENRSRINIDTLRERMTLLEKSREAYSEYISGIQAQVNDVREAHSEYISGIQAQVNDVRDRYGKSIELMKSKLNLTYDNELIDDDVIDYFDFEDIFRGSREEIKNRQRQYVPYFKTDYDDGAVLELGCGRGEFLELMSENSIAAFGVDVYPPFVNYCIKRNLNVRVGDALTFLSQCEDESLNGIVMSQVAEHVNTDYLYQIIRTGYKKLKKDCWFLIETPNPETLSTFQSFNIDGSHIKPVHYSTLEYIFKSNGYLEIIRLSDDYSRHPYSERFKALYIDQCDDEDKKQFLSDINESVFGGRDYTIMARK